MSATKLVTLAGLTTFKTLQDTHNAATYLGISANAASATKLNTARTIDGTSFDGTENITLPSRVIKLYPYNEAWYADAGHETAVTEFDEKKVYIDMTEHKLMYWTGSALQVVAAVDETARIASTEKGAASGVAPLNSSSKIDMTYLQGGVANGVATLDANGLVPSSQLPSYVDDVVEVYMTGTGTAGDPWVAHKDSASGAAVTGETDKIYVDLTSDAVDGIYRWSGSAFVKVASSVSTADKAVKDGDGNTITTTYMKEADYDNVDDADIYGIFGQTPPSGD